jgi:hypothetical protein
MFGIPPSRLVRPDVFGGDGAERLSRENFLAALLGGDPCR